MTASHESSSAARSSKSRLLSAVRAELRALHPNLASDDILQIPLSSLLPGSSGASAGSAWRELYYSLFQGAPAALAMPSLDELSDRALRYQTSGVTPLILANYTYQALRPGAVDLVARKAGDALSVKLRAGVSSADAFTRGESFFVGALAQDLFDYFIPRDGSVFGLHSRFILSSEFYLTNGDETVSNITVDFDDGRGAQAVAFDKVVDVAYPNGGKKHLRVTALSGGKTKTAELEIEVTEVIVPPPDEHWTGLGFDIGGNPATGHAWVYYGKDKGVKHTSIVDPIIISEGFPGNYSLFYLWWSLTDNAQGLAWSLLAAGRDVIILGYDNGTTYLEDNAGVVVACVKKTIEQRQGSAPLIVGGACMGGVIVRYALAYMESENIDHQTGLYFSIDSPHMGISAPASVQYLLGELAELDEKADQAYEKLQSPAGQELLLYVMQGYFFDPAVPSPLRTAFLGKLSSIGSFPKIPKKIGIADGVGDGTGNDVIAGSAVVTADVSDFDVNLAMTLYAAPGNDQVMLELKIDPPGIPISFTWPSCPFTIDSAPGSTEQYFGAVTQYIGGHATVTDCCFVPTISALSISKLDIYSDQALYENLAVVTIIDSDLDEYLWNTENARHMEITPSMADWLLQRVAEVDVHSIGEVAASYAQG